MIIVTGATGFIGRRFIHGLAGQRGKENIICLVYDKYDNDLERTGREIIKSLGIKMIPVDLISGRGLDSVPKSPELVFHLASITDTSQTDHRINDVGTKNLIKAIGPLDSHSHIVFTSSIAVNDLRSDYATAIDEYTSTPERPANEYGLRKLQAENYLKDSACQNKFSLSIIRVCGVYGEGARENGLFNYVHNLALKGSILSMIEWPGKISIMNVDDMVKFIIKVSELPPIPGSYELYIPSTEALTFAEMSEIVYDAYKLPRKQIKLPHCFWKTLTFFAKRKHTLRLFMPHILYNRLWQLFLLINNEFWNRSEKMYNVIPNWKPITFKEYYKNKIRK